MKIGNRKKLIILGSFLLFSVSMILVAQNGVAEDIYPITIDGSDTSTHIRLLGFPAMQIGENQSYDLSEGMYYIYSYPGANLGVFNVDSNGNVMYDSSLDDVVFKGMGTSTLSVIGYPITLNMSKVSIHLRLSDLDYWDIGETVTMKLPANSQNPFVFVSSPGGYLWNTSFRVTAEGLTEFDPELEGGTLNGLGTNHLEIIGHPITINGSQVSIHLQLYTMDYLDIGSTVIMNLPADSEYNYVMRSSPGGILWNTSFSVTKDGVVDFDPIFEGGTLNGLGTNHLEIIGHPITINGSQVSTHLQLYTMDYMDIGSTVIMNLPADSEYNYVMRSSPGGILWNTSFSVTKDGVVDFDPIFEGGTLNGLGTNHLEIIGHPITINGSQVSTHLQLYTMDYMDIGSTVIMNLPADSEYNYVMRSSPGGILWNTSFSVTKEGLVEFDPEFEGKSLDGLGTNHLKIVGHPITLDASEVEETLISIKILLPWLSPGESYTFYLPPATQYPYRLWADLVGYVPGGDFLIGMDGNPSITEVAFDYGIIRLTSDNSPPVTTCNLNGIIGNDGYYLSDVSVTLFATDDISGVDTTEYSLEGLTWLVYSEPIVLTDEGINEIFYRSIDNTGNQESSNYLEIKIDKLPPETQLEIDVYYDEPSGDRYVTSSSDFSFLVIDENSGPRAIYYRINGDVWIEFAEPFNIVGGSGPYIIEYYSVDIAGNEEAIKEITIQLSNMEIISYLSKGEDNPITQFDLIFTKVKQTGEFKLVATNPGQIFYIIEIANQWPTVLENLEMELTIPEDFIFKGSEPIHVYLDGTDITADCIIAGNIITVNDVPINGAVKVIAHLDYGLKGDIYPSLEDFGMIGYIFNSGIVCSSGDPSIPNESLEESSSYSTTFISHQKKTTAIAGYIFDVSGNPIEGVTVDLFLNGDLISTVITDENGFYYFIDIAEGTYEVQVNHGGEIEIQVAVASKNELTELDFTII